MPHVTSVTIPGGPQEEYIRSEKLFFQDFKFSRLRGFYGQKETNGLGRKTPGCWSEKVRACAAGHCGTGDCLRPPKHRSGRPAAPPSRRLRQPRFSPACP